MAPKAKPKTKAKGKVENKKMSVKPMSDKKKQELLEKQEQIIQDRSVLLIQRVFRAQHARRAYASLLALEDSVLRMPTPAEAAFALLDSDTCAGEGTQLPAIMEADLLQDEEAPLSSEGLAGASSAQPAPTTLGALDADSAGAANKRSSLSRQSRPGSAHSKAGANSRRESASRSRRESRASRPSRPTSAQSRAAEEGLEEWQVQRHLQAALPDSWYSASLIFSLLHAEELLTARHLHRIFKHHELRRKNANRQVRVHLVLMQHGDSSRLPVTLPGAVEPEEEEAAAEGVEPPRRTLLPDGWMQVTRTAWALRLHPDFQPHVIFSSSVACCLETAERVRTVLDDAADGLGAGARRQSAASAPGPSPTSTSGFSAGSCGDARGAGPGPEEEFASESNTEYISPKRPLFRECGALDLQPISTAIGPGIHRIVEAVTAEVMQLPVPPPRDGNLPPAFVLMLIAGGAVLEALIACLCADGAAKGKRRIDLAGRLGGGDIVMLKSPPMMRILTKVVKVPVEDTSAKPPSRGRSAGSKRPRSKGSDRSPSKESASSSVVRRTPSERRSSSRGERRSSSRGDGRSSSKGRQRSKESNQQDKPEMISKEIETIRPLHEVWHDALLRNKWAVSHRIRGRDWSMTGKPGGSTPARPERPEDRVKMRTAWRSYAGEPLILSQSEFHQLCLRAGSTLMPLPPEVSTTLRPLVSKKGSKRPTQPQARSGWLQRQQS